MSEAWLAKQLQPFGIRPRNIRICRTVGRGYFESDFKEAFQRYVPRMAAGPEGGGQKTEVSVRRFGPALDNFLFPLKDAEQCSGMSRRIIFIVLAALVTASAIYSLALAPRLGVRATGAMANDAYIWQRAWTEAVRDAVTECGTNFTELVALKAEVIWKSRRPQV